MKTDILKFLCDNNGKIISTNFNKIKNIVDRRFFNLLSPDQVIQFINDFQNFTVNNSLQTYKIENVSIVIDNKIYQSIIKFKKYNQHIIVTIRKQNESNKLLLYKKDTFLQKILFITRLKFTLGSIIPFIFSTFWAINKYSDISYSMLILTLISILLLHIAANTFNDYFDWISGRDAINQDYIALNTGGSRAIEFKLLSENKMLIISWICVFFVFTISLYLTYVRGAIILVLGFIAFFSIYFYSAPPIHLASRYGLGELMHIICLGPLITYGTTLVLSNKADIFDMIIGIPFGLLITCCLLINEYPDSKSDRLSKKNNLAVILSEKGIFYLFTIFVFIALTILIYFTTVSYFPKSFYLILFILPQLYITLKTIYCIKNNKLFIQSACINSFKLYLYSSIILLLSLIIEILI